MAKCRVAYPRLKKGNGKRVIIAAKAKEEIEKVNFKNNSNKKKMRLSLSVGGISREAVNTSKKTEKKTEKRSGTFRVQLFHSFFPLLKHVGKSITKHHR